MQSQITVELLSDATGLGFVTALVVQLIKNELPENQYRPLTCNILSIIFAFAFTFWRLASQPGPSQEEILVGVTRSVLAASLATFGYEATENLAKSLRRQEQER